MSWTLVVGTGIALLVVVPLAVGAALPRGRVVRRRVELPARPPMLWATLVDFAAWPSWNSTVEAMERLPDHNGHAQWIARGPGGAVPTIVEQCDPPRRLVTAVPATAGRGFRGSRSYEIVACPAGSRLEIVERGLIDHPLCRFATLFNDADGALDRFLEDLGRAALAGGSITAPGSAALDPAALEPARIPDTRAREAAGT